MALVQLVVRGDAVLKLVNQTMQLCSQDHSAPADVDAATVVLVNIRVKVLHAQINEHPDAGRIKNLVNRQE